MSGTAFCFEVFPEGDDGYETAIYMPKLSGTKIWKRNGFLETAISWKLEIQL